jgi:hypothetical protein
MNRSKKSELDEERRDEEGSELNPSFPGPRSLSQATIYALMPLVEEVIDFNYNSDGSGEFWGILKQGFATIPAGERVLFSSYQDQVDMSVWSLIDIGEDEEVARLLKEGEIDSDHVWEEVGTFRVILQPPVIAEGVELL